MSKKYDLNHYVCALREYVAKQRTLIEPTVAVLPDGVSVIGFKQHLPRELRVAEGLWNLVPHGVGIRFQNATSHEVVDAHIGFLDAPDAFDLWRLQTHDGSLHRNQLFTASWGRALQEMLALGIIEPHPKYPDHFVIKE